MNIPGSIFFIGANSSAGGEPGTVNGANNGLSVSGTNAQLGQAPGAPGDPAALINNREIPLSGFLLELIQTLTGSAITPALKITGDWNTAGTATAMLIDIDSTASGDGSYFIRLTNQANDVFIFSVSGEMGIYDSLEGNQYFYTRQLSVASGALKPTSEGFVNILGALSPSSGASNTSGLYIHPEFSPSGGTGVMNCIRMVPIIDVTGVTVGTIRGIHYAPVFQGVIGSWRHIAFENTSGDIIFNTTSGVTMVGNGTNIGGRLQIGAGNTNVAPLKLRSGALLTAPQIGALEFLTDALYFTVTTGAARLQLAFQAAAIAPGSVVLGGTNGFTGSGALSYINGQLRTEGSPSTAPQFAVNDTDSGGTFYISVDGTTPVISFVNDLGIPYYSFDAPILSYGGIFGSLGVSTNTPLKVVGSTTVGAQFTIEDVNGAGPGSMTMKYTGQFGELELSGGNFAALIVNGAIRTNGLLYKESINQTASTTTESANASGSTVVNTAAVTRTLPPGVLGLTYTYYVANAAGLTIQAQAGSIIQHGATATATGGSITSIVVGSAITLVCYDATNWGATSLIGTWI